MRLYTCNDLGALCDSLQDNVEALQSERWDRSVVVTVPNRNLRRFIQLRFADRKGITANIRFSFLEQSLLDIVGTDRARLLDEEDLFFLFSTALLKENPADWQLFSDYLGYADHPGRPGRLAGLARSLIQAFRRLEYQRNDWLAASLCQEAFDLPPSLPLPDSATIQAELAFFRYALGELRLQLYPERKPLSSLLQEGLAQVSGQNRSLHLFGFSQVSRFHLAILNHLKQSLDISLYMLTPTNGTADRLAKTWSRPARENLELITANLNPVETHLPQREYPEHLLGSLQRYLGTGTLLKAENDRSLEIAACPGRRREVETVYQNILFNLKEDPTLQLHEIAVLTTDISAYRHLIETVFGAQYSNDQLKLPYNLTDFSASDSSHMARGIHTLFKIIDGNPSRENLFELFFNPCFLMARGVTYDDVQTWLSWVEDLGAFHNRPASPFNFDQALERLTLGSIMQAPPQTDAGGEPSFCDRIPLRFWRDDPEMVSAFTGTLDDLFTLCQRMNEQHSDCAKIFEELLDVSLKPTTHPMEEAIDRSIRNRLKRWQNSPVPPGMQSAFFREFMLGALHASSGGKGSYLTDGITICSLQPMRPLPFRIIYIMGLAEGQFPGQPNATSLDPLSEGLRSGDATGADENRNLFLEMIFAAQERLILTYTSEDPHDERSFHPCSVLLELMGKLEDITGSEFKPISVALHLWDPPAHETHEFFTCLTAEEQSLGETAATFFANTLPNAPQKTREGQTTLTIRELHSFLKYPVGQQLRHRCGLSLPQRPLLYGKDSEPLFSRPRALYGLVSKAFNSVLTRQIQGETGPGLEETAVALYRQEQQKSQFPERHFGDLELELVKSLLPALPALDSDWKLRLETTSTESRGLRLKQIGGDLQVFFEGWLPFHRFTAKGLEAISYAHKSDDSSFLWSFLFFQIWNANQENVQPEYQATIVSRESSRCLRWKMTPEQSRDYLHKLCNSLFSGPYYPLAARLLIDEFKQKKRGSGSRGVNSEIDAASFLGKLKTKYEEGTLLYGLEELVEPAMDDGAFPEAAERIRPFLAYEEVTAPGTVGRKA